MSKRLLLTAAVVAASAGADIADGHGCTFDVEIPDFTQEQIDALHDCARDELPAAYGAGDNEVAAIYREWDAAATGPAAPGVHSGRFLNTFVNEAGYAEYVRYEEDDESFEMPVGTVIAKESYSLREGAPRVGPLFIMTRGETDAYPETDGWIYSAVQPNGDAMGVSQSFCHDCHGGFAF